MQTLRRKEKKSVGAIDLLSFGHTKLILVLITSVGMLPSSSVEMVYALHEVPVGKLL